MAARERGSGAVRQQREWNESSGVAREDTAQRRRDKLDYAPHRAALHRFCPFFHSYCSSTLLTVIFHIHRETPT